MLGMDSGLRKDLLTEAERTAPQRVGEVSEVRKVTPRGHDVRWHLVQSSHFYMKELGPQIRQRACGIGHPLPHPLSAPPLLVGPLPP